MSVHVRNVVLAAAGALLAASAPLAGPVARIAAKPACDPAVRVPPGFCATLFAEGLSAPRHIAVAPNGDVFAASARAGVIALRDTNGDGRADIRKGWGGEAGTGIAFDGGHLYFAADGTIYRWPWRAGQLEPTVNAEVVVRDLPTGGHTAKPIAVRGGDLFVDIGSATNSCQANDRGDRSPGIPGCPELRERAGIWRFRADGRGQRESDGTRVATGTRNPMALDFEPSTGTLWMATHGRDQLGQNWGFSDSLNAELPAEEFGPVTPGVDYGWPFCYYDGLAHRKVQAPEYGGDGTRVGDCAAKAQPVIAFPGHWAPMDLFFYTGTGFPASYRGGAFLSFHGSWNRAPLPQAGYRVVFIPFRGGRPTGGYTTFFEGATAPVRPVGLGTDASGALYVASDAQGKVWKVTYIGTR